MTIARVEFLARVGKWSGGYIELDEQAECGFTVTVMIHHPTELFKGKREMKKYKSREGAVRAFKRFATQYGVSVQGEFWQLLDRLPT